MRCPRPQVTHGRLLFRMLIQIQTRVWAHSVRGEGKRIGGLITTAVTCLPALNTPNWPIKAGSDRESPERAADSPTSRDQPRPSCSDGLLDTANCCLVWMCSVVTSIQAGFPASCLACVAFLKRQKKTEFIKSNAIAVKTIQQNVFSVFLCGFYKWLYGLAFYLTPFCWLFLTGVNCSLFYLSARGIVLIQTTG